MSNKAEEPVDEFDNAGDGFDSVGSGAIAPPVKVKDPLRPDPVRGRYHLPNPIDGKSTSWQRATNFIKMTDDTYHLELWKQRNVAKGVALLMQSGRLTVAQLAALDVKADRERMNNILEAAQDAAEAYKNADEGTALHKSTELADFANGSLTPVPAHHRVKVQMYLDALAVNGLRVVPGMIERRVVSLKYMIAGTFDRIYQMMDNSFVVGDLKTGDSLDLSMPSIAAQLNGYEDGINAHGVFDGARYDDRIKVRTDIGIVVHLPSTRDEVNVIEVDLDKGRQINEGNLHIREVRKIKAKQIASAFDVSAYSLNLDNLGQFWREQLNAAHTYEQLVDVAFRAKSFGQWDESLAAQARLLAAELREAM